MAEITAERVIQAPKPIMSGSENATLEPVHTCRMLSPRTIIDSENNEQITKVAKIAFTSVFFAHESSPRALASP